jgi:hypothetical protein
MPTALSAHDRWYRAGRTAALCVSGTLLVAACASTPPEPVVALHAAEQAIATADRARVADSMSPELNEAREKLTAAQAEVAAQHMVQADRLAQESRVDAELASAKIDADKEMAVNVEMQKGTDTMSQEMQRNSGAR